MTLNTHHVASYAVLDVFVEGNQTLVNMHIVYVWNYGYCYRYR